MMSNYLPHSYHQLVSRSNQASPPLKLVMRLLCSYSSIDVDDDGGGSGGSGRPPKGLSGGSTSEFHSSARLMDGEGDVNYNPEKKENRRMYNDRTTGRQQRLPDQTHRGGLSRKTFDHGLRGRRDLDYGGRYGADRSAAAESRAGVDRTSRRQSQVSNLFPSANVEKSQNFPSHKGESDDGFLEKFKLGFDQENKKPRSIEPTSSSRERGGGQETKEAAVPEPPPQDADEIFKKMKETGLIPNAVAMLHGLCNDGLVQEAMKLFGLMREKGTIPEIVIYTAVVEGFCKAQKLDDAKRIFRKMQSNGISANAFSYAVLIQGLCKVRRLEDALEFSVEMLEAGHSPNLATFIALVEGFCEERGLEAAQVMIDTLRHKGFVIQEKAVREYLDKKGPFLPLVWDAIFGKKNSERFF